MINLVGNEIRFREITFELLLLIDFYYGLNLIKIFELVGYLSIYMNYKTALILNGFESSKNC